MTKIESVSSCAVSLPLDKVTSFATRTVSERHYLLVKVLGDVFFSLGGGADELSGVPVTVSQGAVVLGLIGGALAVVVFTIATLAAARHGIVEARQSGARPPTASFLHRYYLDVLLMALIGLLWWQIQSRGSFLVQSVGSRQLDIDYSLLLGPVLGP